jgi:hypothetical protein
VIREIRVSNDTLVFFEMQEKKKIVLAAVLNNGWALQYASLELRNNKEVVLAAVKNNPLALRHVSLELQRDDEVCRHSHEHPLFV